MTYYKVNIKELSQSGSNISDYVRKSNEDTESSLGADRVKLKVAKAIWFKDQGLVQIIDGTHGALANHMGFTRHSVRYLYPEEALFLMESSCLQIFDETIDVGLSVQEAFALLINDGHDLDVYQVYSFLLRAGFFVKKRRTQVIEGQSESKREASSSRKRSLGCEQDNEGKSLKIVGINGEDNDDVNEATRSSSMWQTFDTISSSKHVCIQDLHEVSVSHGDGHEMQQHVLQSATSWKEYKLMMKQNESAKVETNQTKHDNNYKESRILTFEKKRLSSELLGQNDANSHVDDNPLMKGKTQPLYSAHDHDIYYSSQLYDILQLSGPKDFLLNQASNESIFQVDLDLFHSKSYSKTSPYRSIIVAQARSESFSIQKLITNFESDFYLPKIYFALISNGNINFYEMNECKVKDEMPTLWEINKC